MDRFKHFLLNESRTFLGHKVNDVLTSLQDVQEDMPNLGARHLKKLAEQIVNDIRKILHSNWDVANHKYLKELQKIAVAIQKTIDEKGDLRDIVPAATQAVQTLAGRLGVKVNDLQGPPDMGGEEVGPNDFDLTGTGPAQNTPGQQQDTSGAASGQPQPPMPGSEGMPPGSGADPSLAAAPVPQNPQSMM